MNRSLLSVLALAVVATGLVACAEAPEPKEAKELSSSALLDSDDAEEIAEEPADVECEYMCIDEGYRARIIGRCGKSTKWGTHEMCKTCGTSAQTARGACPEDDR